MTEFEVSVKGKPPKDHLGSLLRVWKRQGNFSPNSVVNTWGSYGKGKSRGLDRRLRTGFVVIFVVSCLHVLFSW